MSTDSNNVDEISFDETIANRLKVNMRKYSNLNLRSNLNFCYRSDIELPYDIKYFFNDEIWEILIDGHYINLFHWLIACKCAMFANHNEKNKTLLNTILSKKMSDDLPTISKLKNFEEQIIDVDENLFQERKYKIIVIGVFMKIHGAVCYVKNHSYRKEFMTKNSFKDILISTNNLNLVYKDDKDNILGKALMEVRSKLIQ